MQVEDDPETIVSVAGSSGREGVGGDVALLSRFTAIVGHLDLDCECRSKLDSALGRFCELEHKRQRMRRIRHAREQVASILALLDLLKEIEDIGPGEPDASVFSEIANLFDDVAAAARDGAADLRSLEHG